MSLSDGPGINQDPGLGGAFLNNLPKAAPQSKTEISASVKVDDLMGYGGESSKLMNHAMGVLLSRVEDMVNALLPDTVSFMIKWHILDAKESYGEIKISIDGDIPDVALLEASLGWITKELTKSDSERASLGEQVKEAEEELLKTRESLEHLEALYKSDPISVLDEDAERNIDLG
jgi:hypothetical protein